MQFFLYSLIFVLSMTQSNVKGLKTTTTSTASLLSLVKRSIDNFNENSRFFTSSSSSSGSTSTNIFENSALELSLGAFNSLFGSSNSDSTVSIGNLSYLTLGALILVPLIIGLALIFYLVGGSGAAGLGTAFRRTDDELEARNLSPQGNIIMTLIVKFILVGILSCSVSAADREERASRNIFDSTQVSIPGSIYVALWVVVVKIIGSAVTCYWIGCEYETQTKRSIASQTLSFNPYKIDWEKFSILEWIAVADETWRKFEPSNLECQKRLICELHQNAYRLGFAAQKMVDAFSYLEYLEVLKLPEELKLMIDDYLDAADRGRSLKKDCGEIYSTCDFSVKKLVDRVTDNEI